MTTNQEKATGCVCKERRARANNGFVDFVFVVLAGDGEVGVCSFLEETAPVRNACKAGDFKRSYLSSEVKSSSRASSPIDAIVDKDARKSQVAKTPSGVTATNPGLVADLRQKSCEDIRDHSR